MAGLNSAEFPWLGGQRDPLNLNSWVWSDGTPLDYTNWLTGQPDNWNNNEKCAHMSSSHKWNDNTCGDQRAFVCKQTCQSGWSAFNGKCYKFFSETKNWDDAQDYCRTKTVRGLVI